MNFLDIFNMVDFLKDFWRIAIETNFSLGMYNFFLLINKTKIFCILFF